MNDDGHYEASGSGATGRAAGGSSPGSADSASGRTGNRAILTCPHCRASYSTQRTTRGRRVRCRHCNHVWRDEPDAAHQVAGALKSATGDWLRLGSTIFAAADHASTVAHLVTQTDKHNRPFASEWIDRTLGRYKIRAVLGQGAMGYVYEAIDKELQREVALKILPRVIDPEHEPLGLRMFLQEARVAARLHHPNVVTIYDIGHDAGVYYFAMERVRGVALSTLVEQHGPLPASQVCYLIAHAARGLAAGHALGIVHRDVKPSNIMIDESGLVKLTDFGLADVAEATADTRAPELAHLEQNAAHGADSDREQPGPDAAFPGGESGAQAAPLRSIVELAGRPVGTPGWISPEAARGEKTTPASDIYGLGLIVYHAMTRDRLVKAETRSGLVRAQSQARSIQRDQLPDSWPPRLRDIVVQCLQAHPGDRYQSAETLAADLLRVLTPHHEDATVILSPQSDASGREVSLGRADDGATRASSGSTSGDHEATTAGSAEAPPAVRRPVSPVLSWFVLIVLGVVTAAVWWTLWKAMF